jgi:1,4-dihydroxy-2-naphthoate octaprenyltransferase
MQPQTQPQAHTPAQSRPQPQGFRRQIDIWYPLFRPFTLTAAAIPVLVGAALAEVDGRIHLDRLLALLACAVLIQIATNMLNEYFDFKRGLDNDASVGIAGSIVRGDLTARAVLRGAIVTLTGALLCGLYLVAMVTPWLLLVGAVSVLGAYLYSGGPKAVAWTPFGEVQVFILMGLLLVGLGYYVHAEQLPTAVLLAALPVCCLVAAILLGNNLRDMAGDAEKGRRTLPIVLGRTAGLGVLAGLLFGSFLLIVLAALVGAAPWLALLGLVALPLAPPILTHFHATSVPVQLHVSVKNIARLHFVQGGLYALGIMLAASL